MFSVSPAKYSPLLVKARKEVPVMLVTKGIDIYTVDSRFLYCGFSIQAGKKTLQMLFFFSFFKYTAGSKLKRNKENSVARLKSFAIYKVFKIV